MLVVSFSRSGKSDISGSVLVFLTIIEDIPVTEIDVSTRQCYLLSQGPSVPLPTGPVVATEAATGIRIVGAVWPTYQRVRQMHFLLEYQPPTGTDPGSDFARWSPAELAILLLLQDNRNGFVYGVSLAGRCHLCDRLCRQRSGSTASDHRYAESV